MRRALSILTAFVGVLGAVIFSVPTTAIVAQASCVPAWTLYNRHDSFQTIYDRNHQKSTTLEMTAIVQVTTNCPGPQYGRRSTTVQIYDGTIFNAYVVVWKPVHSSITGLCDTNAFDGATYVTASPTHVAVFTLYGAQYDLLSDPCWAHAADGGSDQGSSIQSLLASDGAPYFQPTCLGDHEAMQNRSSAYGCYQPRDLT